MATATSHTHRPATRTTGPDTRPPRRRPTDRPTTPRSNPVLTAPDRPSDWPKPTDLTTLNSGQVHRPEPHPWGAPLPGHRPPNRRRAIGQWLAYAIALTVAVVVVVVVSLYGRTLANPTPTVPTIGSTPADPAVVDSFGTEDSSRYHGPNHPDTEPAQEVGR